MMHRVVRPLLFAAILTLAHAGLAHAQFGMSGGSANASRLGFAYKGAPEISASGQIRYADYPVVSSVDSGSAAQKA
jgi:hypothetical protein